MKLMSMSAIKILVCAKMVPLARISMVDIGVIVKEVSEVSFLGFQIN